MVGGACSAGGLRGGLRGGPLWRKTRHAVQDEGGDLKTKSSTESPVLEGILPLPEKQGDSFGRVQNMIHSSKMCPSSIHAFSCLWCQID